jgi:hypothetical protein
MNHRIRNHTLGQVRYFTYSLEFPDGDHWMDQLPFVGPLDQILPTTQFGTNPDIAKKLLLAGEAHFRDSNGVTHRVQIESERRPRRWGIRTFRP